MEKPKGYDETSAGGGDYSPFEIGNHYLVIRQVAESKTMKDDLPKIIVYVDTAPNDTQPEYFSKAYKEDTRENKKWPYQGTLHVKTEEADRMCTRSFKGFITSVEKSNPGFKVQWGPEFTASLKGKLVGAVYRTEYNYYNGKESTRAKFAWFVPNSDVPTAPTPDPVESDDYKAWKREQAEAMQQGSTDFDDFSGTPFDEPDDMPFA